VDGTLNKQGAIKHYLDAWITINGRRFKERFYVTELGKEKIILGAPWLRKANPDIDWKNGTLSWRNRDMTKINQAFIDYLETKRTKPKLTPEPLTEEQIDSSLLRAFQGKEDRHVQTLWIQAKSTIAQELAFEPKKEPEKPLEEKIPTEYHDYLDVFSKEKSDRFPESKPWDHKIEMKDGFLPKPFKTYNLTGPEQHELQTFIQENLGKNYIRLWPLHSFS